MADPRLELILLLVSLGIVLLFFAALRLDLLNTNQGLPAALPLAAFIVAMYVLLGWLLLGLIYGNLRQARALTDLARCPLVINSFNLINLLAFGRLGLIQSLPAVGIVLVPLILLGTPTKGGYLVIFLFVLIQVQDGYSLRGGQRGVDLLRSRIRVAQKQLAKISVQDCLAHQSFHLCYGCHICCLLVKMG
jgi:hypothetical protein